MNWVVFQIASGRVFFVAVALLVAGWGASRFGAKAATATATSALALLGVGLNEARYQIMPVLAPVHDRQIAVIGDSITAGHGENDLTQKWTSLLRDRHGVAVEDFSKAGATAGSAAKGLEQESIAALVVIVEIGGNDFLGGGSVADFEAGLDALLKEVVCAARD